MASILDFKHLEPEGLEGHAHGSTAVSYPAGEPEFVSASGCHLVAADGERYLDGCAGTFNINLGYGHPAVTEAVAGVMASGLPHLSSSFQHRHVEEAARALVDVSPPPITHCHFKGSTGGSTAVEQAMRHAWVATGKRSFVTFRNSHHGQTIATTSLSGMPFRRNRLPVFQPVTHVEAPDCYRCPWKKNPATCNVECIDAIESAIDNAPTGEDDTAAFVGEPILGAGGGITPPKHWWAELQSRLSVRGILLIVDEVQTFGRTGSFFAAEHYGIEPDMIAVSKGISGIGIPGAAALLMSENLRVLNSGERSLTSAGSVLACAAIEATIRVMREPGFFEQARRSAEVLADRLLRLEQEFECIGTVRGFGLMTGIELVKSRSSKAPDVALTNQVVWECMKNRLLLRTSLYGRGSFVKVRPPLVITEDEVHDLCDRLHRSLDAALTH
ncbi:MAG: aminotransferase class III-fold pyridoxal phosphate-dependent enzyme [Acidobacteriota bacterium]